MSDRSADRRRASFRGILAALAAYHVLVIAGAALTVLGITTADWPAASVGAVVLGAGIGVQWYVIAWSVMRAGEPSEISPMAGRLCPSCGWSGIDRTFLCPRCHRPTVPRPLGSAL